MNYQIKLNDGQVIVLGAADINVADLTTSLNNPAITFINFGGAIVNKHLIMSVVPVDSQPV